MLSTLNTSHVLLYPVDRITSTLNTSLHVSLSRWPHFLNTQYISYASLSRWPRAFNTQYISLCFFIPLTAFLPHSIHRTCISIPLTACFPHSTHFMCIFVSLPRITYIFILLSTACCPHLITHSISSLSFRFLHPPHHIWCPSSTNILYPVLLIPSWLNANPIFS